MISKKYIADVILSKKPNVFIQRSATAFAPINIALIKYWGKRNETLNLPVTNSLSIALPDLGSTTTLSVLENTASEDVIFLNGIHQNPAAAFSKKITDFLDLFRAPSIYYRVETHNTIPTAAGLASSASGFAALVLALNNLHGWVLSKKELSILARLGSGSACRSLWNGFVEWHRGIQDNGMDSFAEPLNIPWPELKIEPMILSAEKKTISSRNAMKRTMETVSRYETDWPKQVAQDLKNIKLALAKKDFELLGKTAEANALAMHQLMLEARPSINYSLPETLMLREKIWNLRKKGVPIFFTQDAGPNLKLLFLEKDRKWLHN